MEPLHTLRLSPEQHAAALRAAALCYTAPSGESSPPLLGFLSQMLERLAPVDPTRCAEQELARAFAEAGLSGPGLAPEINTLNAAAQAMAARAAAATGGGTPRLARR